MRMTERKMFSSNTRDVIQWLFSGFFLLSVVIGLIFVLILHLKSTPELDETRCKCVCPHNLNTTDILNTTVFLKPVSEATECECESVVPLSSEVLCLQCQCTFETRNKLLIAVIIVAVTLIIFALLIYTLVYAVIQCNMKKKAKNMATYQILSENINGSQSSDSNITQFQEDFRNRISQERSRGYT